MTRNNPIKLLFTGLLIFVMLFNALPRREAYASGLNVLINEVDSDTPSYDALEFIELYDGGVGNTDLTGLVLVLFNGSTDASYLSFDLDGLSTDINGYFVIGTVDGADIYIAPGTYGWLQNGADAVALYVGDAADFPNDAPVTTDGLLDAIVYDTNDDDDADLLVLLNAGQPQVNEDGAGDKDNHSNQRCPNGSGGALNTDTYAQFDSTPGTENDCNGVVVESPPSVLSTTPADAAAGVAIDANIEVTFSEAVDASGAWFDITCTSSGAHSAAVSGGSTIFTLDPDLDFDNSETCTVTVIAAQVTDQDSEDPPDNMEVSTDAAEFIELYDYGVGNTDLTGLVLVLFNGSDDASYLAFDLDGFSTDADGYFVLCGDAGNVANCDLDVSPNTNLIQNGADAAALLVGDAADFTEDTPVTTDGLLDAIVYDTSDSDDPGLLVLLNAGQPQVNERDGGDGTAHSNQRCPDGSGGARNTDTYYQRIFSQHYRYGCRIC